MNQTEIYEQCYAYERNRRYAAMVNQKRIGLALATLKAIEAEVLADTSQGWQSKPDPVAFTIALRARTVNTVRIYCAQQAADTLDEIEGAVQMLAGRS